MKERVQLPPNTHPASLSALCCDFLLVLLAALWFSGGLLGFPEACLETFRLKPGIHRLLMGILGASGLGLALYMTRLRKRETPLIHFLRGFTLSHETQVRVLFVFLAALWGYSSVLRHEVFHSSFDMAIFTQAIWNTAHGNFLYSSIKGGICLLGDHFSPLLAILAVPYYLFPDPRLLLWFQALAAAACVFPLDQLARLVLKRSSSAILILFAFAFYLPVRNAVRFDFHPEVLVMPILIYAHLRLAQSRLTQASIFLFLALLAKENVALVTFASGFYAVFFLKKKGFGIAWMLFSVFYFFAVIKLIIPAFAPQGYFYLDANFIQWKRFGLNAFAQHLMQLSSFAYLIKIFAPVGFLSFFDPPSLLLTVPMLAQNLIARNDAPRSIFFQYTALLTPYVFISAIYGSRKILDKPKGFYILLFSAVFMAGVSEFYVIHEHQLKDEARLAGLRAYFRTVPANLSVRTHEFLAPHLANRKNLHIYENNHPSEGGRVEALNADRVIVDRRLLGVSPEASIQDLITQSYLVETEMDGIVVLKKAGQKL